MIESIEIMGTATYGSSPEVLDGLSKFNFLFGSNGSGKTTITRVIADEDSYPDCRVTWKRGTKLQTIVYNRDFVEKNFNQSTDLKGIFTLGEKNIETLRKISAAKAELDILRNKIEGLTSGLRGQDGSGGKEAELRILEAEFVSKCWAQKHKHDAKLSGAFTGLRNNKEKFRDRVLQERVSNAATLVPLADLEKKAETVYGPPPVRENAIPTVDMTIVVAHESNPILKKHVLGKDDVDITAMIQKLGNSDWVRQGRSYFEANGQICPFCQQTTPEAFAESLNDYFDETFETDTKAISDLETNYKTDSERLQQEVASILASPPTLKVLDVEKLRAEKALLDSKIAINVQRLAKKKKEPSLSVELESLTNVVNAIEELIRAANHSISEHNEVVANLVEEHRNLTAQVWKYILATELKADLADYDTKQDALTQAIKSMTAQIASLKASEGAKAAEIRELEKETTSIQPSIDGINALLLSFDFRGFLLKKADQGAYYKLVRSDNADAKETLSEGERAFVTFLYFYHLLKGSTTESGMTTDRVVVFDDPVSSLDSEVLFIVASLIKALFEEVRVGKGHIKQIFVLTHNVYFHKEVTFNRSRPSDVRMKEETFWIVRKAGMQSKLLKQSSNPVKTSYDLLWGEVRNPERSNVTIQNTLRRILDYYFKILGGIDFDDICSKFEGREKVICNSLFSWAHDGSHFAQDDLYVSEGDSSIDTYLKVFKAIFERMGHIAHYNMMMGAMGEEEQEVPTVPAGIRQPAEV
jgi:wobble nucleotide-excising tRNase